MKRITLLAAAAIALFSCTQPESLTDKVDPAGGDFVLGSPAVKSARVNVGDGKTLVIRAENNSPENIYVQSVEYRYPEGGGYCLLPDRMFIPYDDLKRGGELIFHMSSEL